jgi:hypothetical protein
MIATPMPDQTSDPAAERFSRFGCVEHDERDREHAEARGEPGDEAACRHRRSVGPQPPDDHCAGENEWLARQSARAPTFALSEGDASVPSR